MSRRLGRVFAFAGDESGLTLVELLVASAMSVVLVGAVGSMVVSTMRAQPDISRESQDVSSARWVLERMTREIRNGIRIESASPSSVALVTYVRRSACGGSTPASSSTPAIKCEVTYQCTTTACSRMEAPEGVIGTWSTLFSGIGSSNVFCYVPSTETDPLNCGPAQSPESTTYVGVRLSLPKPSGTGALTVSDGASLRNATLLK
jgi:type II secretory pathway pseudopilin PulG